MKPADLAALEDALVRVGGAIDWPAGVGVRSAVTARIIEGLPRRRAPVLFRPRIATAVLAGATLVLSGFLAFSPGARDAVADFLGVRGIQIQYRETLPEMSSVGRDLSLGAATTLERAESEAGFDVLLPDEAEYGTPDAVYVREGTSGPEVSLVYEASPGLPASGETGVGLLVLQLRADIYDPTYEKSLGFGANVQRVRVHDETGYWISGDVHVLTRIGDELHQDAARLAGNTLVWEQGDVTMRLESALGKRASLRIARTFR